MNIYLEIFGYIGTALVLLSMMMTSVVRLRLFNTVGSVISMIYSMLCNAWPVVILNAGLILINVWQLIRLSRVKVSFSHVTMGAQDMSLQYFLDFYRKDIQQYFPGYSLKATPNTQVHMVYAGAEPVGVLVGTLEGKTLNIELDYAAPKYRDCSVANYLFGRLKACGVTRLVTNRSVPNHNQYLTKMGFTNQEGLQVKNL